MRIIFIRHGEPDYENDTLTETGFKQAQLVAQRLKYENIEEIWSSTHGRALNSAKPTAELLGLPVKAVDFMREVTWGSKTGEKLFAGGHPWDIADEMARLGMDLNSPDWRTNAFFKDNKVVDCAETVENGIDEWLEEHGYKRNGLYYEHLIEEEYHRTVAFFCHGGSSSAAIAHIMNLPFPYVCTVMPYGHTSITILNFPVRKGEFVHPRIELFNDTLHTVGVSTGLVIQQKST